MPYSNPYYNIPAGLQREVREKRAAVAADTVDQLMSKYFDPATIEHMRGRQATTASPYIPYDTKKLIEKSDPYIFVSALSDPEYQKNPAAAILAARKRQQQQRDAIINGRPYAQMRATRTPKPQPTVASRFKQRAGQLGSAIVNPTARNNIFSPIINPLVDYAFNQTRAGQAANKIRTSRGVVTKQDEAVMRNSANMSTGKALKTLVEGTPVFRQAVQAGKGWAWLASKLNGSADADWSLMTGAPMNEKGERFLTRFKANPWVSSFIDLDPTEMFGNYTGSQIHNYLVASQYQRQMRAAAEQQDPKKRYQMQLKAMKNNFWRLHFMPDQYSAYGPSLLKYPLETIKKITDPNAHTQSPYPTYFWHFNTMVPTLGDQKAFLKHSDTFDNLDQFLADQRKRQVKRRSTETNVWGTPDVVWNKALGTLNLLGGKSITHGILPVVTQTQIDPVLSGYRQFYTKLNDLMNTYNANIIKPGTPQIAQVKVLKFPRGTKDQFWDIKPYSTYIAYTGAALQKLKDKLNSGQLTAEEQSKLKTELASLQAQYKELLQKTKGQVKARNTIARLMPGYLLNPGPSVRSGRQYKHMPALPIQNIGRIAQWGFNPAYDKNREQQLKNMMDKFEWIKEALGPVLTTQFTK